MISNVSSKMKKNDADVCCCVCWEMKNCRRKKMKKTVKKLTLCVMHFFYNFFIIKEKRNSRTDNQ